MPKTAETARAEQGQAAKTSLLARLQAKKPQSATYDVVLDSEPVQRLTNAEAALSRAELFPDDDALAAAKAEVDAARPDAADAVLTLHFRALGRPEYEALMLAHPPTDEQKANGDGYNVETFAPALVAATCVDPDTGDYPLTERDVTALFEQWNQAEVGQVWATAVAVCTQVRNPMLPFGSGRTRG